MTGASADMFKPQGRGPSRWLRRVVLIVGALLLVAAAGWGVDTLVRACGGLGSGVTEIDGECVGVTDGSYLFAPELADVQAKIARENAEVAGSGAPAVTIALLNPITADETSALSIAAVRRQLEGAHTAQYRANHSNVVGDRIPLIRLVLANEGSHQDQWKPVVQQLVGMVDDEAPLVAVAGHGVSVTQTRLAAEELSAHDIPMVGAVATADELTDVRGFFRAVAPNKEYVQSLSAYLHAHPELDSAILVVDSNSEDPDRPDLFTRSLKNNMRDVLGRLIKYPQQTFVGIEDPRGATPALFSNIVTNICAVQPEAKVVLFAGRRIDVSGFVEALEARVCADAPITVVTAATELDRIRERAEQLVAKKITVVYATAADSAGWAKNPPALGTPAGFADFRAVFDELGFDVEHLNELGLDTEHFNGDTLSTHDAVLTAVKATRLVTSVSGNNVPIPADVRVQLGNLNGQNFVPGASGDLSFSGDDPGNPRGKPLPVLTIPSGSESEPYVTGCPHETAATADAGVTAGAESAAQQPVQLAGLVCQGPYNLPPQPPPG